MTLFRNDVHRDVWRMRWCEHCWQPDEAARRVQGKDVQCPIWERAMRTGHKPVQWDRTRRDDMEHSIRCNEYTDQPPITRRQVSQETQDPMFNIPVAGDRLFVPVDGWPDEPSKKGTDHA